MPLLARVLLDEGARVAIEYPGHEVTKSRTHVAHVFQVLPDTLGLGPEVWRVLGKAHELRNRSEYEGDHNVEQRLVTDLLAGCARVATKVQALPPPAP